MTQQSGEVWAAGDAYERYMGRWSRLVADGFVTWLESWPECGPGARWLDVGCGTGALTAAVTARCRPRAVLGLDRSAGFVAAARAAATRPAHFAVADGTALPVRAEGWDAAVSGLVLNFLPSPSAALAEAARAVRPGGLVAAYVWDYAEGMTLLRHFWDAARAADPSSGALDEGRRFAMCRPEPLRALWERAGFADVTVAPLEVTTAFAGFTDLWEPFLSGQGPAPGYVATLDPPARDRLRDLLRETVPTRPDGSIALPARAWAVRGRRPRRVQPFDGQTRLPP
uniref:Class I SAM-dependent methyltransferase n=1 Tax=Streptomyces sp. NBC_00049 TaxID=2903617 RepID=A0AAU2JJH6_9ACTN